MNMNILFPIAGRGQRFKDYQQNTPKPLVKFEGKTLLEHSISTLNLDGQYIFVTRRYETSFLNNTIEEIIYSLVPNSKIIVIDSVTEGMASTCLCAEKFINTDDELIVTNVDQYLCWDSTDFLKFVRKESVDACVSTYDHADIQLNKPSKYAFVKLNEHGYAEKFREKFAISEHAMNGIYYWKHGSDFVRSAKQMISDDVRINGEYYLSPSYNYLIQEGKCIRTYKMNETEFYSLGSPEEISNSLTRKQLTNR